MQRLHNYFKTYAKQLSIFGKLQLVNDIKQNADGIRRLVSAGDREVYTAVDQKLGEMLGKYEHELTALKNTNPLAYAAALEDLLNKIHLIETSSMLTHESKLLK